MNNEPNRKQGRVPLKHDLEVMHRRYYSFLYKKARAITGDHARQIRYWLTTAMGQMRAALGIDKS